MFENPKHAKACYSEFARNDFGNDDGREHHDHEHLAPLLTQDMTTLEYINGLISGNDEAEAEETNTSVENNTSVIGLVPTEPQTTTAGNPESLRMDQSCVLDPSSDHESSSDNDDDDNDDDDEDDEEESANESLHRCNEESNVRASPTRTPPVSMSLEERRMRNVKRNENFWKMSIQDDVGGGGGGGCILSRSNSTATKPPRKKKKMKPRKRGGMLRAFVRSPRVDMTENFSIVDHLSATYPHRRSQISDLYSLFRTNVVVPALMRDATSSARTTFVPSPTFVIGSSASGKTSVLLDMMRLARQRYASSKFGDAYVDCSVLGSSCETEFGARDLVCDMLQDVLRQFSRSVRGLPMKSVDANDDLFYDDVLKTPVNDDDNVDAEERRVVRKVKEEDITNGDVVEYERNHVAVIKRKTPPTDGVSVAAAFSPISSAPTAIKSPPLTSSTTAIKSPPPTSSMPLHESSGVDPEIFHSTMATTAATTVFSTTLPRHHNHHHDHSIRGNVNIGALPTAFGRALIAEHSRRAPFVLILDRAERLLSLCTHTSSVHNQLLSQLLLLPKTMGINLWIVVVTTSSLLPMTCINHSYASIQDAVQPTNIHFGAYRGADALKQVLRTPHMKGSVLGTRLDDAPEFQSAYDSMLDTLVASVRSETNNVNEIRRLAARLWPVYAEPLLRPNNKQSFESDGDRRRYLDRRIRPKLRALLSGDDQTMRRTACSSSIVARFLSLAAYLCQHNRADTDRTLFTTHAKGKKKRKRRRTISGDNDDDHDNDGGRRDDRPDDDPFRTATSFPLERLLSVLCAVFDAYHDSKSGLRKDDNGSLDAGASYSAVALLGDVAVADVLSELRESGVLRQTGASAEVVGSYNPSNNGSGGGGGDDVFDTLPRYHCTLSYEDASLLAKEVDFPLSDMLTRY